MAGFDPRGYGKNRLGAVRSGTRYGGNQSIANAIARQIARKAVSGKVIKEKVKTVVKVPKAVGVKHTVKAITPPAAGRVRWFR